VTAAIHRLAERGLRNFLRHLGVLEGPVETRASRGLSEAVILRAADADDYLLAPESGLFETLVGLGQDVTAGEIVGRMHFPERPDRAHVDVRAGSAGVVCSMRAIATTQQGDCLVVTGRRCGREELLR
jgi:predicted deacylase